MIFFTPIGSFMVLYPLSWDIPLMAVAFLLWFVLVDHGKQKKKDKSPLNFCRDGIVLGFFVLSALLVVGMAKT
jgi:hypothetical protein